MTTTTTATTTLNDLPKPLLREICQYVGPGYFLPICLSTCKSWPTFHQEYQCLFRTQTGVRAIFVQSIDGARWIFRELHGRTDKYKQLFKLHGPCDMAASHGNLELLQWLRGASQSEPWAPKDACLWKDTCAYAAQNGHLSVLQWARAHGCDWNRLTFENAAQNGHLSVLQWAHANGCPWDKSVCQYLHGRTEILQWAKETGCF